MNFEDNNIAYPVSYTLDNNTLLDNLYKKTNELVNIINVKKTGIYGDVEALTSQKWLFDSTPTQFKEVFWITVECGTLPNTGTTNTAHNLAMTTNWEIANFYGVAKDPTAVNWIKIDHLIDIDATNINITTTSDLTAYTVSRVTIEYVKP